MESKGSRILGVVIGPEGERCTGLAKIKMCQGCAKVSRISELLSLIHLGFCIHSQVFV